MEHKKENLFTLIQRQFDNALKVTSISEETKKILLRPKNEIIINFPVKLENGQIEIFKGYRVQHNDILGPFKGGLRFHQDIYLDECNALAFWMTIKCSLQNIPFGGGKGGVKFNPNDYGRDDLKRISQEFSKALYRYIGSDVDIPAPDMGTNEHIMNWMTHAYNSLHHCKDYAVFTGKSTQYGGCLGRSSATGMGVYFCIKKWAEINNIDLKGKTYILQGFGNVGSHTAMLLNELGMSLIAIGDHTGYIWCDEGYNVFKLDKYNKENKSLQGYPVGKSISKEEFFSLECCIVIPAALELQITEEVAQSLNCQLVVEAANGPTDEKADEIIEQKGIDLIPDILANSGGVIVSYLEWLQNKQHTSYELDYINNWLKKRMDETYQKVHNKALSMKTSKRIAAYNIALKNIDQKYKIIN